jgi:hypothetical protein
MAVAPDSSFTKLATRVFMGWPLARPTNVTT